MLQPGVKVLELLTRKKDHINQNIQQMVFELDIFSISVLCVSICLEIKKKQCQTLMLIFF